MKLTISKSKNASSLYVTKSIYVNGVHTSKIVEKLGTYADLEKKLNGEDPIEWAKAYVAELTRKEKEEKREVMVRYSPAADLPPVGSFKDIKSDLRQIQIYIQPGFGSFKTCLQQDYLSRF